MYWRCVQPIVEFLRSPDIEQGFYILDTQFGKINYVSKDISPVISTRINANNSYFVIEIMKDNENIIKLGNYSPSGHNASTIVDPEGVAPTVMENHGTVTAVIEEAKVINPLKGQTSNGWHFEQQVYDEDGITRAVKAGGGSGNIPKVIEPYGVGRSRNKQGKLCDLHLNDYTMCLHAQVGQARPNMEVMVAIPEVQQVGNIYPDKEGFKNRTAGRIYSAEGISPTLRTVTGGNIEPKIVEDQNGVRFRIRKLTPKECFRLQDVSDSDIDKIQGYRDSKGKPISNTQQYKLAGNSITVAPLYHVFRKMFIDREDDKDKECKQLTLF